jgi:hypothetical protein
MRYLVSALLSFVCCTGIVSAETLTITVRSTQALPNEDTVYVIVPDGTDYPAGAYPMTKLSHRRWRIELTDVESGKFKFYLSRNDIGAPSYNKFKTDRPNKNHSITIKQLPRQKTVYVHRWRWYTPQKLSGQISTRDWTVAERDEFILGMGLIDYHWKQFNPLIKSTMENIAAQGFSYVSIAMSPTIITGVDPLTVTTTAVNTPTDKELRQLVQQARQSGLALILYINFNPDPSQQTEINEYLADELTNTEQLEFVEAWAANARLGVEDAIALDLPIVVLNSAFFFNGYSSEEQKSIVNQAVLDALPAIVAGYDGIVTTDFYTAESTWTWYGADEIDWVGDKWFLDIAGDDYDASIETMYQAALGYITTTYQPIFASYGKPVFLNQLAVPSWDGAAGPLFDVNSEGKLVSEYYPNNPDYPKDYQEQADAYEAAFRAIADTDYIVGAFSFSYMYAEQHDKSANIRSKPAELVWSRWWTLFHNRYQWIG